MPTNALYDLDFWPGNIERRREEAIEVFHASSGHWTVESMLSLEQVGSFVKESQRQSTAIGRLEPFYSLCLAGRARRLGLPPVIGE